MVERIHVDRGGGIQMKAVAQGGCGVGQRGGDGGHAPHKAHLRGSRRHHVVVRGKLDLEALVLMTARVDLAFQCHGVAARDGEREHARVIVEIRRAVNLNPCRVEDVHHRPGVGVADAVEHDLVAGHAIKAVQRGAAGLVR